MLPLKVKDVNDRTHVVLKEQKTGKQKRFKINPDLMYEISVYTAHMSMEDYIFPSKAGGHIQRDRAHKILTKAANKVGLEECSSHTLRKTFAYHLYRNT